MLTGLRVGAGTLGLKGAAVSSLCEEFLRSYREALGSGKAY